MGARPLRRVIEEQIEDKIAEFYLENPDVGEISVTVNDDDEIVVERSVEPETAAESSESESESDAEDDNDSENTETEDE